MFVWLSNVKIYYMGLMIENHIITDQQTCVTDEGVFTDGQRSDVIALIRRVHRGDIPAHV